MGDLEAGGALELRLSSFDGLQQSLEVLNGRLVHY